MRVSLGAGIAFLIVLGAVFVPKALHYEAVDRPSVGLTKSGAGPFVVTVASVNRAHPLSTYRAELNITNGSVPDDIAIGPLDRSGPWGDLDVNFSDADGNGVLSFGDTFTFAALAGPGGPWTYSLSIYFLPADEDATAPCPCAVGRITFVA
ncbi:MAG TPA: hypothetical protein VGR51_07025 [Thermoplasmata archaeon]|jgi:hypothetical protein|nr:hypothetical protein [Thermoplasmata archaeon]